jgi:hypothetical protein
LAEFLAAFFARFAKSTRTGDFPFLPPTFYVGVSGGLFRFAQKVRMEGKILGWGKRASPFWLLLAESSYIQSFSIRMSFPPFSPFQRNRSVQRENAAVAPSFGYLGFLSSLQVLVTFIK